MTKNAWDVVIIGAGVAGVTAAKAFAALEAAYADGVRLVITVDKSQLIYLGSDPVNIHDLGSKVQSKLGKKQDAVFLRCDETVPFGIFAAVIDTLRQSGINNISIVTEPITDRNRNK